MKRTLLYLGAVLALFACDRFPSPEKVVSEEEEVFLSQEAPAALSEKEDAWLSSLNDFSFSFAEKVSRGIEGSYVVSPVSLGFLLGMISNGVDEDSRSEISRILGYGSDGQDAVNRFCRDVNVLLSSKETDSQAVELANAVFFAPELSPTESFHKNLRNYYDAEFRAVDFSKPETALKSINAWSSQKTRNRIPELFKSLNSTTLAIIANAIYFKAPWAEPFLPAATKEESFFPESGIERKLQMMHGMGMPVRYMAGERFSMVSMPFRTGDQETEAYSMQIVLPNPGVSVDDVLRGMTGASWKTALSALVPGQVDLKIPKFEVETEQVLNSVLSEMGISKLFSGADYSYMWTPAASLSMIKQLARISIEEKGAEAAAVSVGTFETSPAPGEDYRQFYADRPFLYVISARNTRAILFLGCYR